jgi:hypothetical protein
MTVVSVCDKELILILLAFLLWRRNGFTPTAPDWFLLACLSLTIMQTAFAGTLTSLALDVAFVIPYAVGRVTVLSEKQESLWGRRAVWIVSVLSILGMIEVFILGEGPRTLLYAVIDSEIEGGQLTTPFHGTGFVGLREAATMVGPPAFAILCMIAMIIWWVYFRNPLPAGMIGAGLVCSVTRGAWLSTAIAIILLAVIMGQLRKLSIYVGVALVLFLLSVPFLGLSDYLQYTKTGQDDSNIRSAPVTQKSAPSTRSRMLTQSTSKPLTLSLPLPMAWHPHFALSASCTAHCACYGESKASFLMRLWGS